MVDSSLRYFGCTVGFGFGVVWMTMGLGSAIVCLLVAALGYGVVFTAERARANPGIRRRPSILARRAEMLAYDGLDLADDLPDDAAAPLAAEADYGWPVNSEIAHTGSR